MYQKMRIISKALLLFGLTFTFLACSNAGNSGDSKDEPSTITLEKIQMEHPLSGGIFDQGYTLTRTVRFGCTAPSNSNKTD